MEKFDFKVSGERKREIAARLDEIADKLGTEIEATERETLSTEASDLRNELDVIRNREAAALASMAAVEQPSQVKSKNEVLREILKDARSGGSQKREITLGVLTTGAKNNIESSGAITLTINDLLPRLSEGLIFGKVGMQVQTGVRGNIVWPYATDNVTFEEVGETAPLNDQAINFDKIVVNPARSGATIAVSNEAIDDSSFNLLAFLQDSLQFAQADYLNWKTFSHDNAITGIKGPFASQTGTVPTLTATYQNVLNAKAELINAGVNMNGFCYVLDASAEALLKATPKAAGQGGFIIQDGKLDGDPYFVSHYIRNNGSKVKANDMYIGLGVWSNFAANQHGDVRLIIDPYTKAKNNETVITINTKWSLTTLRPQAFKLYKLAAAAAASTAEH